MDFHVKLMLGLIWLRFPLSTCLPCGCFALLYLQHNMFVISNNRSSLHQWQVIVSTQLKTDRSDSCADKTVLHGIYCAATAVATDGELWSLTHKCAYAITTETSATIQLLQCKWLCPGRLRILWHSVYKWQAEGRTIHTLSVIGVVSPERSSSGSVPGISSRFILEYTKASGDSTPITLSVSVTWAHQDHLPSRQPIFVSGCMSRRRHHVVDFGT